ncbi:ABC transporter A family protein [Tieghemostelium lacteum]|uniref:ABC transporter A family protein n=1 Tax=Tieghemostelium lacteum TaxID=361077 RepID=A0A152A8B6_TIELA|nr:ABC transporter A family protein [Tieghemostelium lacteum]|eukprot:KYR02307.1 ABC transporter A family protein [Tieghemostelium lacteum]
MEEIQNNNNDNNKPQDISDELNYFQTTYHQTVILLKKNFKLSFRKYITTAIQLTVPFFFILGLFLIQLVVDDADSTNPLIGDRKYSIYDEINPILKCTPNREPGSYCYTFIYSPNTSLVVELIRGVLVENSLTFNDILGFESSDQLNTFILENKNITQAAYVFNEDVLMQNNGNFQYDIQYNSSCISFWDKKIPCLPPIQHVIAPMQISMDRQIISYQKAKSMVPLDPISSMVPIQLSWSSGIFSHPKTKFYNIVTDLGSIFFFASLMFQFVLMLQDMVDEKEKKLKEGMRMMGLKEMSYYLSWFITYFVFITLDVLVLIASGSMFQFKFFTKNDFGTYFVLFLLFGISIMCLAFFLSSLLSKSHAATFIGFFLFILFSILQAFIPNMLYIEGKPYSIQAIFSLLSPIVFAKGLTDLAKASDYNGLRWSQINDHDNAFPLNLVYRWIVLDSVVFVLLGWYIDNVFPGEYGTAKPFYFFLTPTYWTGNQSVSNNHIQDKTTRLKEIKKQFPSVDDEDVQKEEQDVENMTSNDPNAAVILKNLVKVFWNNPFFKSKKDFYAVKGLSLSIQKNQLFCLLGPNGAGKTTTMSMLFGLFGQTEGDAYIFGHSIRTDMAKIRKIMGVCMQFDLLWGQLTGREHLELYSEFKNRPKEIVRKEIEDLLSQVGMSEIADQRVNIYSGGEKRRLSIAISMIGNPKIIFLDEPTTGLDVLQICKVWEIILKAKQDRAIVLTTHSMMEADILSDKIGIMALGKLRCLGDNLHLKNKFGTGYKVTIYLKTSSLVNQNNNNNNNNNTTNPSGNVANLSFSNMNSATISAIKSIQYRIINFVTESLPGSTVLFKSTEQITFSIPRQRTEELPYFLETLEVNQNILNIQDIDVNLSTLEEVFLKIAEDANKNDQKDIEKLKVE